MKKSGKAAFISEDDLKATLNSIKGKYSQRNKSILLVSHFMGLRAKEMASLKVKDIFDTRTQTLKDTVRLLAAYTKGGKYREVFLFDPLARRTLLDYLLSRPDLSPEQPLFMSQKGTAYSANTMQRMIAILYKNAGVVGSSHSGRRSFASRLIRNGVDIYSVQQLLGHSNINTTQEYFSSDPILLKEKVSKLSQSLNID